MKTTLLFVLVLLAVSLVSAISCDDACVYSTCEEECPKAYPLNYPSANYPMSCSEDLPNCCCALEAPKEGFSIASGGPFSMYMILAIVLTFVVIGGCLALHFKKVHKIREHIDNTPISAERIDNAPGAVSEPEQQQPL